ncbi:MAG: outer membrane protein OmpA-like peptidoglycan-associated protein [Flammeovirgaceae bacterium]|jgi:outer membrane protein OmpA-like peptidoglycan-associated protein
MAVFLAPAGNSLTSQRGSISKTNYDKKVIYLSTVPYMNFRYYLLLILIIFLAGFHELQASEYVVSGYVFGVKDKKAKPNMFVAAYKVNRNSSGNVVSYQLNSEAEFAESDSKGGFRLILQGIYEYHIEVVGEGFLLETFSISKKEDIAAGEHIKIEIPVRKGSSILLSETFVDADFNTSVRGIEVTLKDAETGVFRRVVTDSQGKFFVTVPREGKYLLFGNHKKHLQSKQDEIDIRLKNFEDYKRRIPIQKISVGYKRNLGDLKYNINEEELSKEGKQLIDNIYQILANNTNIKIQISCHTDSRGDDDYNLKLSQKRAEGAVSYLHKLGIPSDRMTAKGFGETQLTNECGNGIKCDTEKHEENRRLEFTIIAIE